MQKTKMFYMLKRRKYKSGMVAKPNAIGLIANIIMTLIVALLAFICLAPMWHTLMYSISDGFELMSHDGLTLIPIGKPTLNGFKLLFQDNNVLMGYGNTLIYVVGTTGLGFLLNILGGYALYCKTQLQKPMTLFVMFTLMFSGGMIPTYMVMNTFGLTGTRFAIILSEATMAMFIVMGANAFRSVPEATVEAAYLDGAGHIRTMFMIMLPQCFGIFMVTILNTFIASWNSWVNASIYVPYDESKWPLQMWINRIISDNENFMMSPYPDYSRYLLQFCVVIAATLPIMVAFPFFQKYIEKGAAVGAVKG